MKHRKIKSEIAFYLQNFDQIEYHEYVDRQTRDFCRIAAYVLFFLSVNNYY